MDKIISHSSEISSSSFQKIQKQVKNREKGINVSNNVVQILNHKYQLTPLSTRNKNYNVFNFRCLELKGSNDSNIIY